MFETNTQNNSALISLARAAEITGYHQDYLGQLCRLGRLPAKKVGRNWFTSEDALKSMSSAGQNLVEGVSKEPASPDIIQAVTISQVEGLPITLRTVARPVVGGNTLQSVVTNMRIESLQREVAQLRSMLNRLMAEVARHTNLLEGRISPELSQVQDSLRHNYISNFDFNAPDLSPEVIETSNSPADWKDWAPIPNKQYKPILTWVIATVSLAAIAFIGTGIWTGNFLGSDEPAVKSVYYHSEPLTQPQVAGVESEILPTENIAPLGPSVVQ